MPLTEHQVRAFRIFEKSGWENAAVQYHQHWGILSQQSASAMLDAAGVRAGSRVLDVATGAGYVAALASGRGANATGVDFSAAQVELARSAYPETEFVQGDAEALSFDNSEFDSVVVGFGVNHFPHPEVFFTEAFRVLRKGGRLAFTVWAAPAPGQGFGIVLSAIDNYGVPIDLPPAPPYFRFADIEESRRALIGAGFTQPEFRIVDQFWRHQRPDQVFEAFSEGAVRATAMIQSQPADARNRIQQAVRREVEELSSGTEYVVPVPAALSWATKP